MVTELRGYLSFVTRTSSLTPSDTHPTTFWITSPLNTLTNNVAAGSEGKNGVGIWYLFPVKPVGPSNTTDWFNGTNAKFIPIYVSA